MRITLLLLSALLICSCSRQADPWQTGRVVIAGKIRHFDEHPDRKDIGFGFNGLLKQSGQNTLKVSADAEGAFRMETLLGYPQEVLMNYRQTHRLCLAPGDSLYIELDARVWNDTIRDGTVPESVITFAGNERAAALNRDMADLQQYYQPLRLKYTGENSMEQAIRKYSPEEFETFADSKEREYRDVWNRFRKEHRPVKELNAWVEDMLRYGTWQAKLTYANICQVIKQQNPEAQAPELPKNFIRFVKSYDPDDNRIVTMEHAAFLDMYNQYLLESIYREMDDNPAIKSDDDALPVLPRDAAQRTDRYPEQIHRAGTIRQRLHARKNAGRQRRTERCVERRTRRRNATDRTRLDDPREPVRIDRRRPRGQGRLRRFLGTVVRTVHGRNAVLAGTTATLPE